MGFNFTGAKNSRTSESKSVVVVVLGSLNEALDCIKKHVEALMCLNTILESLDRTKKFVELLNCIRT